MALPNYDPRSSSNSRGTEQPTHTPETIKDPLLENTPLGVDKEPPLDELLKDAQLEHPGEPATADTPAGRTTIDEARRKGPLGWFQLLGPGLVTGASDDDPSGIGTYSQVGSQFGFGLLWTALFTFPLMIAVQELCARIALQTGVGLGVALRRKFPTALIGLSVLALLIANTFNLGADLGAVAAGGSLLTRGAIPTIWLVIPAAALVLFVQFFMTYTTLFKVFKWLTVALFAYVITVFIVHPSLTTLVVSTLVPHFEFTPEFTMALVAVLGTTISPYLFFWQASSEVDVMRAAGKATEEERRNSSQSKAELYAARVDITVGMFFSQLVMYSIIATSAAVLHAHGKTDIQTAEQAASALAPLAGPFAFVLFGVGIIGTGLLAIPILSGSAAYAIKEFFGWKGALSVKPKYRPTFYGIIALATVVGVIMNLVHLDAIKALFYSAVINGVVAPPLLVLITLLGSDRSVMGAETSGLLSRIFTWAAAALMGAAALLLIFFIATGQVHP